MPGAGKSTVGVLLAKIAGLEFIDSDIVIQKEEGRLRHEIISDEGTDGFIKIEERINAGLNPHDSVIATGGSVIYGPAAMEHLKDISTIVYLKLEYEALALRLGDLKKRGVALKEGQTLLDLYNERIPLYEKYADVVVDADRGNPHTVAKDIMRACFE